MIPRTAKARTSAFGLRAALVLTLWGLGETAAAVGQSTTGTRSTTLTVKVLARSSPGGPTSPVTSAFVCVGDTHDTRRYGRAQMHNPSGEISFPGVPLGVSVVVTAYIEGRNTIRGGRTEARLSHDLNPRVEVVWEPSGGPSCNTPVFSKELPAAPGLAQGLRTDPAGPLVRSRRLEIFTRSGMSGKFIEVTNAPTHYRTSQSSSFAGAQWQPVQTWITGQIRSVVHEITGADGRKTVYFQLRNAAGEAVWPISVDFLDLYSCRLEYRRAHEALSQVATLQIETLELLRAQSRTLNVSWPSANEAKLGYGMHLRWARNVGDHPIELSVGGGLIWNQVVLDPREYRTFHADMRGVRCP